MKHHLFIGCFGEGDHPIATNSNDRIVTYLNLTQRDYFDRLDHGINDALNYLGRLGVFPNEIGIDLLIVATLVYAADTRISRITQSQDEWTREIELNVPVSDVGLWNNARQTLKNILNFLTGDRWNIHFRVRPRSHARLALEQDPQLLFPFNMLSLFSGGLDSLIDAINVLEAGHTPLFISHAGEGATSDAQRKLFAALGAAYPGRQFARLRLWMVFKHFLGPHTSPEDTTRGRSFLFFAAGIFAASGFSQQITLRVPENGLIALNVPLDPLRLGSLSTRTTHPYYMARWGELATILGVNATIENSYWNKTKGEMASECSNGDLLRQLVPDSLSCSSPSKSRWIRGAPSIQHCGFCLPCLIRRAALNKALGVGNDPTTYTLSDLQAHPISTKKADGKQIRSFQFAIERLNRCDDAEKLLIHKPGSLKDYPNRWDELADVYKRGLQEVGDLLDNVTTRYE
jgi:hypothetical protein